MIWHREKSGESKMMEACEGLKEYRCKAVKVTRMEPIPEEELSPSAKLILPLVDTNKVAVSDSLNLHEEVTPSLG